MIAAALMGLQPAGVSAQSSISVVISEVHPSGSSSSYGADWFEITNTGNTPVDVTGWRMDDNSNLSANAVPLRGVTTIPARRSAIFFEGAADGSTDATILANFSTAWFGSATPPAGVLIGAYGGSGVGLGTGGDAVNLFDASGNRLTGIGFGAAVAGATFDNTAGVGSTALPLPTVTAVSTERVNGAFVSASSAEIGSPGRRITSTPLSGIDLSTYVRIGRFDLPEPTRTTPPPNSVLAQEVSAVTYNWDTDTLFVVGDRGTSIVQISKTGQLIDSMTLSPGASPQGTDFYDPEGLTYVGGGQFVMTEERDRQVVLFTYVAGTTLTRAQARTVKLGTFVDNIGLEGLSYDPLTSDAQARGFIVVKEISPQGIFQTDVDFVAGTASNGSATTENSTDLFNPALLNLLDIADVFALSNLPSLTGDDTSHLLVLSQESGRIVKVDRNGAISSTLTILLDPGNPLSVADHQHEGLTMDGDGRLYVVSENGGGDTDHPQLWVYAPSEVPNQPPADLVLSNQITSIAENVSTAARIKVADIAIVDDGLGTNSLTLIGADAGSFEVDASGLYIRAGAILDFETKSSYSVTVALDDATVGTTPDATADFALTVTDVDESSGPPVGSLLITEVSPWSSGNSPYAADWFEVKNTGAVAVDISGWRMDDDSNAFGTAVPLNGITSIAPGESVIFLEAAVLDTTKTTFLNTWFGANPPAGLQVGSYSGSGVGLSTGGDSVSLFDAAGNRVTGISFGTSTAGFTFDNTAGLGSATPPLPAVTTLSTIGVNNAFTAINAASPEVGSPGGIAPPVVLPSVVISEVAPWGSGTTPYAADWFEVRNTGPTTVNVTGWKMDDSSAAFATAVALNGITSIAPGESVIFMETSTHDATKAAFLNAWFGANPPAALQVGSYSGGGVGLSTSGDAVTLFTASGNLITGVGFGASTNGVSFDNAAGLGSSAAPFPAVSTLSVSGVSGAFVASNGAETGSPGTVVSRFVISEVSPWSSGNTPYAADWFEITNTDTVPVNITGWKMDDNSNSLASSVALRGVVTIPAGGSAIFLEGTADGATDATIIANFSLAWFGSAVPPAGLLIGAYGGGGVGLSTGGDAVNLFDANGNRVTGISFGASTTGFTFDNVAGLGSTTLPLPTVTTLSIVGVNRAFLAADGGETGSPGGLDRTPPAIGPVSDLVVEATGPAGATVIFTVPSTLDDVDGAGVASCAPLSGTVFALGVTTVTCTAQDAAGNSALRAFVVTVRDTTAPALTVPKDISVSTLLASGTPVSFNVSAADAVDASPSVVCSPVSGSTFPIGVTEVECTATDDGGNAGTATFDVTVTLNGRIYGAGYLADRGKNHYFVFRVSEIGLRDYGRFEYWVRESLFGTKDDYDDNRHGDNDRDYGRDRRKPLGQFEATSITSVAFSNDPAFTPQRGVRARVPGADSVSFAGIGRWNGKPGYTFTVTATDQGEPGRRRDTFTMVVMDSRGQIVAEVNDVLDGGNIQSTRLARFRK